MNEEDEADGENEEEQEDETEDALNCSNAKSQVLMKR